MTYVYREVVVSGSRTDTEGTSKGIKVISSALEAMGWSVIDNLTSEAGVDHKMVLSNNNGEYNSPAFQLVMTSGVTEAIQMQLTTAWDTGGHQMAASGTYMPATTPNPPGTHNSFQIQTDENGTYVLWIGGDKDAVCIVSKELDGYNNCRFGRPLVFNSDQVEPYGLYYYSAAGVNATTTTARALVGEPVTLVTNPTATAAAEFLGYGLSTNNEPRLGLSPGPRDVVFTALPMVFTVDHASYKGVIGLIKNQWMCTTLAVGLHSESVFTVEETGDEYIVFASTQSLVMRKT